MQIDEIPATGRANVACCACGHAVQIVDRYVTDFPPIPRFNPEAFIEFYTADSVGDPDDLLGACPGCGEPLDLDTVSDRPKAIPYD